MKTRGIIIFVLFLLVIPLVVGFEADGTVFVVRKTHIGAQGLTGEGDLREARFTLDYNQPGDPNANSTLFGGINVGWFDKNTTVPPLIKTEGGRGGGSSGGGGLPACFDGLDNDNDGLVDMRDPDCESVSDNNEYGPLGFAFECVPNFICTSWSECRDGEQSRICSDINACEEERTETRDCVVPVREMPAAAVIADETKIEVKAEKPVFQKKLPGEKRKQRNMAQESSMPLKN